MWGWGDLRCRPLRCSRLHGIVGQGFTLQPQHPTWALVHVVVALLPIQLSAHGLGKQWLLGSDGLNSDHCSLEGVNRQMGDLLSLPLAPFSPVLEVEHRKEMMNEWSSESFQLID